MNDRSALLTHYQSMPMSEDVVLGTNNQGKAREFQALLGSEEFSLLSWKDFDKPITVVEDGETFLENAMKKAEETARVTGLLAIADDSGLEVDYLKGAPGVYSARYAGAEATDQDNYEKLLEELKEVPDEQRVARFVCVIAVCSPDGTKDWVEGECRGVITDAPRGGQGFGYDPVFYFPALGKTFAEISAEEKNQVSHRAEAIRKLRPVLKKFLE